MGDRLYDLLNAAVVEDARGVRLRAPLEPLAGPGQPVKSAVYSDGSQGQAFPIHERPMADGGVEVCSTLLSAEASRNLAERALVDRFPGLSSLRVNAPDGEQGAYPELPKDVLELQHSVADTKLRMTVDADGVPFVESETGQALHASGPHSFGWLYEHVPGVAISGAWWSHGQAAYPSQHPNAKILSSLRTEITAFGVIPQKRGAGALDPLVVSTGGFAMDKDLQVTERTGKAVKGEVKPSTYGVGNIAPTWHESPWVVARDIAVAGQVSFDVLRRLQLPQEWSAGQQAAARTVLATLVVTSAVAALDGLDLRSGCELTLPEGAGLAVRTVPRRGQAGVELEVGNDDPFVALEEADAAAVQAGLPSVFGGKTELFANADLLKAIELGRKAAADE